MEQAIAASDWDAANRRVKSFEAAMEHHFSVEEEALFPALEHATPQAQGPIRVMTMEHIQMRHMIRGLAMAVEQSSKDEALGLSETLLMTMQQHNMKEENILYPMADRCVPDVAPRIAESLQEEG